MRGFIGVFTTFLPWKASQNSGSITFASNAPQPLSTTMSRASHLLHTIATAILFLCGCVSPAPAFVDSPETHAPKSYKAYAEGNLLIIEVHQQLGHNVGGFKTHQHENEIYISPYYISSGGAWTQTFNIDLAKYRPRADWPEQAYWWQGQTAYPIMISGFWDKSKCEPIARKKIDIVRR